MFISLAVQVTLIWMTGAGRCEDIEREAAQRLQQLEEGQQKAQENDRDTADSDQHQFVQLPSGDEYSILIWMLYLSAIAVTYSAPTARKSLSTSATCKRI